MKVDAGVSVALTRGQGGKEPGSLRGSLAWQQVGLGPGLGQEAFSSSFSLHFRSPMSLPSTLTPPTPSAQVSVKPTCICPGFNARPGHLPGQMRGRSTGFCSFLSPPLALAQCGRWGEAGIWSQVALDSRPAAVLFWLRDLGEITAPHWASASSPASRRCDTRVAHLTGWSGEN